MHMFRERWTNEHKLRKHWLFNMQEVGVTLRWTLFSHLSAKDDTGKYDGKQNLWSILAFRERENTQTLTKQTILKVFIS